MPRDDPPAVCSEINVTPLVDVVLVLLIIFMVVTPMLRETEDLRPPRTTAPPAVPGDAGRIAVDLTRDGTVRIGDDVVPGDRVVEHLRSLSASRAGEEVLIRADAGLPFGAVRNLMTAVQGAGFAHVGLVADRQKSP